MRTLTFREYYTAHPEQNIENEAHERAVSDESQYQSQIRLIKVRMMKSAKCEDLVGFAPHLASHQLRRQYAPK